MIGIAPILSQLYDDIINGRFCNWYKPNMEQAAYRELQGCTVQLFSLLMAIHYAKQTKKELVIGLMDFEKAFDYLDRVRLFDDLKSCGIGYKMLNAIRKMYSNTKNISQN